MKISRESHENSRNFPYGERSAETPEHRRERLSRKTAQNSVQRDSETPEERQERQSRDAMGKSP